MVVYTGTDGGRWRAATIQFASIMTGLVLAFTLIAVFGSAVQADAQRPPRPTPPSVEQVRLFGCAIGGIITYKECATRLEEQVNKWLREKPPEIRIIDRRLQASENGVILALFYEVNP